MSRPLALHSSALSEAEYNAFSSVLNELLPPNEQVNASVDSIDDRSVSFRETRGWIRGKYNVETSKLDQILGLFPQDIVTKDSIKATQLFAILRLISHVQMGKEVDRTLVFTQAVKPLGLNVPSKQRFTAPALPVRTYDPPMVDLSSDMTSITADLGSKLHLNEAKTSSTTPAQSVTPTPATSPNPNSNPFRRPSQVSSNQLSGSALEDEDDISPRSSAFSQGRAPSVTSQRSYRAPAKKSSLDVTGSELTPQKNPFLARSNSAAVSSSGVSSPPLPPRKPSGTIATLPPPRHPGPPLPPKPTAPKPSTSTSGSSGTTSALIRQSLIAAKTAQKASEGSLQAIKTWEVIKSSAPAPGSLRERAKSRPNEESPTRRSSPTRSSTSSHDNAARGSAHHSTITSRYRTRSPSPSKSSSYLSHPTVEEGDDFLIQTDPNTPFSSSTIRPVRSKSLHSTPPSKPPAPPVPKRKRPESIQVLPSPPAAFQPPTQLVSRDSSQSRGATLQRSQTTHGHSHSASTSSPFSFHQVSSTNQHSATSDTSSSIASSVVASIKKKAKATEQLFANSDELNKLTMKAEGGLAPSRGYIAHRGRAGEGDYLVNKHNSQNPVDSDSDSDDLMSPALTAGTTSRRSGNNSSSPFTLEWDAKGPRDVPLMSPASATSTQFSDSQPDWVEWERSGREAMMRGRMNRSLSATPSVTPPAGTPSAQRQAVQLELDELKNAGRNPSGGWNLLS